MKNILLASAVLWSAAAFGQSITGSQARPTEFPDHPQSAHQQSMASGNSSLVGGGPSTYTVAQGEQPLWEFGPISEPAPLGDVARAVRKEKLTAKKAEVVFEKQGK